MEPKNWRDNILDHSAHPTADIGLFHRYKGAFSDEVAVAPSHRR